MISQLITKWWFVLSGLVLLAVYLYGYHNMFFHQDDLDWFILVNRPLGDVLRYPIADHINYLFRLLFSLEWRLFGLTFPPYLLVSLLLHAGVILMLYTLVHETTGRRDLAAVTALLFTINTNWNEVVLWVSGQTISITVLFVLMALHFMWRGRARIAMIALACLTSALSLGLPIAAFLTYGVAWTKWRITRIGWGILLVLFFVGLIYAFFGGDGTSLAFSWRWLYQVAAVWILSITHTVLGRLLLPFDRFETIRLVLIFILGAIGLYKGRSYFRIVWKDEWSRFLLLQLIAYYLIVALGRAQYGIGIMRAERYAYLGLALGLLLVARMLRFVKIGKWMWAVPMIVLVQSVGFYTRAQSYVLRPQQLRGLIQELEVTDPTRINQSTYLPHFVLNDERLTYGDLFPLLHH